jgi:CBS domain-containing protein
MKTVQQVLHAKSGPVFSVRPDTTVYDALALMARHDIGALLVLDGDRLTGMFSERDYARKVILHGRSSRTMPVADIMTKDVVSVPPDFEVDTCLALMTDHRVRHLPVVDRGEIVGLVSIGDLVKTQIDEQRFVIEQLEHYIAS